MNNYIDTNYNVIMNYETKLSISDSTGNTRAKELADEYKGDFSGNSAVKINGETYVMTVFNDEFDKYRLLGTNNSQLKNVSDNGVYVCTRIADEQGLDVGDTFVFSIYGDSTKQYTVSVAGIVCSNTEGFQISSGYADDLSIPHKIDTIYTDIEKDYIKTNDEIVSVMSKSEIIKSFDSFMSIMNEMIALLVVFSCLLAFVVLYNLGSMSFTERYRELATLKVLGFKDKKIRSLLIRQNISLSIIGIITGCPVGYYVMVLMYKLLASEYELTVYCAPYTYIVSVALTLAVCYAVSMFTSLKVKKIDMVESLKAE